MRRHKHEIPNHVWWSLGIDPDDPADWPLMSSLAIEVLEYLGL
jgi:hypothetical protein